jgi:4-amino-4-deoxy-L-arabinose transferase-like glycosyltransferase
MLLLCVGILICLLPLSSIEITSGHEAREGIRLRALLGSGDWFFSDVLRKPPLYYWFSGLIAGVRGGVVDALTLRLPSGVLGLLSALLVASAGWRVATRRGALWAGFLLLTAPLHVQQSHSGRTDMTLSFFVTASLLFFFLIQDRREERQRAGSVYLFSLLLACAFLSKGPVGVILVTAPIVGFLVWRRDWQGFQMLLQPGPLTFFGVLAGGWCVLALWGAGEEFWRIQVMEENVARFAGGIDRMSPFYYIGPLLGGFAPWSLLLPFAVWRACKEREHEPGPFFLTLWWISTVLFFQLAAYKRARYLLPTLPPAALVVGWWLSSHLQAATAQLHTKSWWKLGLIGLSLIVSAGVLTGAFVLWEAHVMDSRAYRLLEIVPGPEVNEHAQAYYAWIANHFGLGVLWLGALALCLGLFLRLLWSSRYEHALASLLGALVLLHGGVYPSWLIATGAATSPRAYAHRILKKLGTEHVVSFINPYDEKAVPVLFFLQERLPLKDVQWWWGAPQPRLPSGYYLVSENRRKELVSGATGTWTEVLRDTEATQWPITLFFYTAPEKRPGSSQHPPSSFLTATNFVIYFAPPSPSYYAESRRGSGTRAGVCRERDLFPPSSATVAPGQTALLPFAAR